MFLDERLIGGYSYFGVLKELKDRYNSVESFGPRDITECHLTGLVRERIRLIKWSNWFDALKSRR